MKALNQQKTELFRNILLNHLCLIKTDMIITCKY